MFIHQKSLFTFRLSEWPSAQASHFSYFTSDKQKYDLTPLIEHLAEALYNTNKAFVWHSTFSLINVTSNIASLSYGYQEPPHVSLRSFFPLSFTFAFTTRNEYDGQIRPRHKVRPQPHTYIWGSSLRGNSDFITVTVPKQIMRKVGLITPNIREMKWLYMAVGAFTKGFAHRPDFYTHPHRGLFNMDPIGPQMAASKYQYTKFQAVLKHLEYHLWGYSKDMWELAPNMLSPRAANEDFIEYYCVHLAKHYYGKFRTDNISEIERKAYDFVESGVLDIIERQQESRDVGPTYSVSRQAHVAAYLAQGEIDALSKTTNVQSTVTKLLQGQFRSQS